MVNATKQKFSGEISRFKSDYENGERWIFMESVCWVDWLLGLRIRGFMEVGNCKTVLFIIIIAVEKNEKITIDR